MASPNRYEKLILIGGGLPGGGEHPPATISRWAEAGGHVLSQDSLCDSRNYRFAGGTSFKGLPLLAGRYDS